MPVGVGFSPSAPNQVRFLWQPVASFYGLPQPHPPRWNYYINGLGVAGSSPRLRTSKTPTVLIWSSAVSYGQMLLNLLLACVLFPQTWNGCFWQLCPVYHCFSRRDVQNSSLHLPTSCLCPQLLINLLSFQCTTRPHDITPHYKSNTGS